MFPKFDRKYFDRAFATEDPWRYNLSQYEITKYQRQMEAIQGFSSQPQSILEVGCAEGLFTHMLAQSFPQAKITGVDISPTAIERARAKYGGRPNVQFVESDAIQFFRFGRPPDQRFDVIVQSECIHYIFVRLLFRRQLYSYLVRMVDCLNEGGIFVTSNGINPQTRFMLPFCYRILGKLCRPELAASHREWSDFREKHLSYDLRVFRVKRQRRE